MLQMLVPGSQSSGLRGRGRLSLNRGMRGISGSARIIHRRKRGGRKRLFVPVRANRLLQTKSLTGVHLLITFANLICGKYYFHILVLV